MSGRSNTRSKSVRKGVDPERAQSGRMALAMKDENAFDPIAIDLHHVDAVVLDPDSVVDPVQQVIEAVATGLLSSGKHLPVLDRFIEARYSTKHAVRDVQRDRESLNLRKNGLAALAES